MATSVRPALGASSAAPSAQAAPSAPCSASAASSAACARSGDSPPSSAATAAGCNRAASSSGAPSTSSTTALPAARAAAHPCASKPASTTVSPSTRTARRTKSPHGAPPADPQCRESPSRPHPRGASRWSSRDESVNPEESSSMGRVRPEKGGSVSLKGWPQLGAAAGELNLLLASSGALRHGPRPVPSRAPIPVMLAQRAWRLADKLGPCPTLPAATELGLTRPARAAAPRPAGRARR